MGNLVLWYGGDYERAAETLKPILQKNKTPHALQSLKGSALPVIGPDDVGMAMGAKAYELLVKHEIVPKGRSVTSMRGTQLHLAGGQTLYCTFDPVITYYDPARLPEITWDFNLAHRLLTTGTIDAPLGKYRWVEDFSDAMAFVKERYQKHKKRVAISLDLETVGLNLSLIHI